VTQEEDDVSQSRSGDSHRRDGSLIDRIFSRSVSVWLLTVIIFAFALGTVAFGWYVKRSVFLKDDFWLARAAVTVASLPTYLGRAWVETKQRLFEGPDLRYVRAAVSGTDASKFTPVKSRIPGAGRSLLVRHGSGAPTRGWYIMVGAFNIGGAIEDAALVLSPEMDVVHYWLLGEGGPVDTDPAPPSWNITHGFTVLEDGSVIYVFRDGISLNRIDKCGRTIWTIAGDYTHSVTQDKEAGAIWTIRHDSTKDIAEGTRIVQLAIANGAILREFSMADVIAANPDTDILELRRSHEDYAQRNERGLRGRWLADPFHLNDVDPLPEDLASEFPQFSPGDLLISGRETSLLFVLDPNTLAIKWWRIGETIRQHDPDWMPNGRISVLNNRTARDYSEIVEIDPRSGELTVTVDGREIGFYSRIRGNHQVLPFGGHLIASTQQGRVIAVSADGSLAMEFLAPLDERNSVFGFQTDALMLREENIDHNFFDCPGKAATMLDSSRQRP